MYDLRSIFDSDIAIVTKAFEYLFEWYKNRKVVLKIVTSIVLITD